MRRLQQVETTAAVFGREAVGIDGVRDEGAVGTDVLPWWESDVEKHVVGGKVKSFQVYIVENSKMEKNFMELP